MAVLFACYFAFLLLGLLFFFFPLLYQIFHDDENFLLTLMYSFELMNAGRPRKKYTQKITYTRTSYGKILWKAENLNRRMACCAKTKYM